MVTSPLHRVRRLFVGLALAAYGSAALLGYGLHEVVGCDHHESHAEAGHDHGNDAHGLALSTTGEDCSICSFLAQAQSGFVPEISFDACEPLHEAPQTATSLVLSLLADAPLARGPPAA